MSLLPMIDYVKELNISSCTSLSQALSLSKRRVRQLEKEISDIFSKGEANGIQLDINDTYSQACTMQATDNNMKYVKVLLELQVRRGIYRSSLPS
jgi:hypothetical protein